MIQQFSKGDHKKGEFRTKIKMAMMPLCGLFVLFHFMANAQDTNFPIVRLACRSANKNGFPVEYFAKDENGNAIVLNLKKKDNRYFWSCPDILNPHRCPYYLTDTYEIRSPLFLIINDPNINEIEFDTKNKAACERSKPKNDLSFFEYGYKTNFDRSPGGHLLHRPIFTDRLGAKNFPFTRIIVFGDSFSDNGKVWEVSGDNPSWPYFLGRFSNGPVWTEQVPKQLESLGIHIDFLDFAVSGSSVLPGLGDLGNLNFSLMTQVKQYLSIISSQNEPSDAHFTTQNSVFLIQAGLADLRDMLIYNEEDLKKMESICGTSTAQSCAKRIVLDHKDSIYSSVLTLIEAGGKNFMIADVPNMLKFPRYAKETKQPQIEFIKTLVAEYNKNITEVLIPKLSKYPNVKIIKISLFDLYEKVFSSKETFAKHAKIYNIKDPCVDLKYANFPTYCAKPETYVFWDDIHFSETGHCLIRELTLSLMYQNFVPKENGTYEPKYNLCPHSSIPSLKPYLKKEQT